MNQLLLKLTAKKSIRFLFTTSMIFSLFLSAYAQPSTNDPYIVAFTFTGQPTLAAIVPAGAGYTATPLTRGTGINSTVSTTGSGARYSLGTNLNGTAATNITAQKFITFSINVNTGNSLTFNGLPTIFYNYVGQGMTGSDRFRFLCQYSINGGTYKDFADITGGGNGGPALMTAAYIPTTGPGFVVTGPSTITFRMVPYGFPNANASFAFGRGNYTPNEALYIQPTGGQVVPLSADFGKVAATAVNDQLKVTWTTLNERNTSHFLVQASGDSKNFQTIGRVNSRAINGNSDLTIDYEFSASANTGLLSAVSLLSLLLLSTANRRYRKKCVMMLVLTGITVLGINCTRDTITDLDREKPSFIRVVEVDKNGGETFSRIVKVVEN